MALTHPSDSAFLADLISQSYFWRLAWAGEGGRQDGGCGMGNSRGILRAGAVLIQHHPVLLIPVSRPAR